MIMFSKDSWGIPVPFGAEKAIESEELFFGDVPTRLRNLLEML